MKNSHPHMLQAGLNPLALPSITALLAFREAAAHLSFRKAADMLGLTPSAVSHQIRGLEAQFGARLFARSTRAVMLTPAGAAYLKGVKAALEILATAGGTLMELAGSRQSALRVSALPFFSSTVMLPQLAQLQAFCPGLTVKLEATHDYADFDGLGVDVAIRYGKRHAAGLRFERLVDVVSLPVCKPKLARRIVRPCDLGAMTLIHLTAQPDAWPAWLAANKVPDLVPAGEMWVDSVPSALEAAEHGLGIALAMHPLIAAREGFGKTLVAPFKPSGSTGTFYLVTRSEQTHDRRIAAFRAWLSSALEQVQRCP
jgi:LysR family glycine cleavage system transcriptional activator